MAEVIVSPPALKVALKILRDGLADRDKQPVHHAVPERRPPRMVTVELAGGQHMNLVTVAPVIIVQAWDDDPTYGKARAEETANLCHGLMRAAAGTRVGDALVRHWQPLALPGWLPLDGISRFQVSGQLRLATRSI